MSAADREHELWEASGQYVRGEISLERLKQEALFKVLNSRKGHVGTVACRSSAQADRDKPLSLRWTFIVGITRA